MDWQIDRDSDVPYHKQVEKQIKQLIQKEQYQKGALLPADTEIAERLDISRNTVRMTMQQLEEDGIIIRRKGIGSWVKPEQIKTNPFTWKNFTREMDERGYDIQVYEEGVSWVLPPETVVEKFDVDPVIQIPEVKRVYGDDMGPIVLSLSYIHPRLDIAEDESFDGRLYENVLEPKYNVKASESDEIIEAVHPDKTIKKALNIKRSIPILYRERVVYDEESAPIEYNESYYKGDRCQFDLNITPEEVEIPEG